LGFVDYNGDGQYGVEGKLNNRLAGTDGLLQAVTDVNLVPLSISDKYINKPAKDGENIVLTIERNVQSYVEKALAAGVEKIGADRGSVVVMDPQNGKVLAIANTPSYNASKLNEVTDVSSFNNGVISTPYEPGSDVKTFTVATGVDKGVVDASATYVNTDYIEVEDRTITNATKGYTGEITFQTALNWSLNTGFVTIAQRLGDGKSINRQARDTRYDYFYNKFHLGKLTGIELANEATGIIISPEEVEGNAVRYSNMAFGQGMDVTMIQVATAFCSLVNGGKYYQPTIVAGTIDADGEYVEKDTSDYEQIISKSTADQVREMTHIARSSFFESIDKPGYYVGGKTGTSQVVKDGVYADDETVATYLGYGGSEKTSKYVIMVQVSGDHKEFGGAQDAMPIFTDISNWLLDYFKVTPKG
jgi:cell division protein FtsI/penicillin-binding protein 2